jgi:hypothetical protein
MEDIILQYTWPRIDAEVSKHRNHLLKAPFCVHPKTGRVCVPVDPTRIEEFDPAKVPTVGQLLKEIDEAMVINNEDGAEAGQHIPGRSFFNSYPLLRRDSFPHELNEGVATTLFSSAACIDSDSSRSRKLRSGITSAPNIIRIRRLFTTFSPSRCWNRLGEDLVETLRRAAGCAQWGSDGRDTAEETGRQGRECDNK